MEALHEKWGRKKMHKGDQIISADPKRQTFSLLSKAGVFNSYLIRGLLKSINSVIKYSLQTWPPEKGACWRSARSLVHLEKHISEVD